jgi:hypothetical protein
MSCPPSNLDQLVSTYINLGWDKLQILYNSTNRISKIKFINGEQTDLFYRSVDVFAASRGYLVQYYFDCANRKYGSSTIFKAFGSTNLFSDYDLTLLGEEAPNVMITMFYMFLKQYKNSLPVAFDSNLYCSGYFSTKNIRKIPEIIRVDSEISALSPIKSEDKDTCLQFAMLKLTEGQIKGANQLKYYEESLKLQKDLDHKIFCNKFKFEKFSNYNSETLQIVRKYQLQSHYSTLLYDILYGETLDTSKMFDYVCTSNYFAIEGYYTPCTINVVVLEIQAGYVIKLQSFDYLCSAIENFGDLNIHYHELKESGLSDEMIVLSLSKYILRVYYSLNKIFNGKYDKYIEDLNNNVVKYRGETDPNKISQIDFSYINYHGDIQKWIDYHNKVILNDLELILSTYEL